ncbi:Protein fam63a-like [Mycena venus]|uniref:Protein fam63a-like n=1 Tax=Mycena venus TaxID=2733690 RepID=A0A8H6X756_9AGAR|nr:Protein fam63a-like [Mycena venus]
MADDPSLHTSEAEVWYLKRISFGLGDTKQEVKIVTQNFNGPCSFIAICNILILRGDIRILPPDRVTVSYEFLSQLVGEYLLMRAPDVDISAALSIMPLTQKGMDLNPLFTGATSFRPAGDGGALKLFKHAGIELVHGWLVDPASPEAEAILTRAQDYDTAVTYIVDADYTAKGQLVVEESSVPVAGSSSAGGSNFTPEERSKIEDAMSIRQFLDNTQSQLTYHGLFHLATTLPPGALVALFRNSHLSVLHKSASPTDASLYSLVTDHVFLHEGSVVWERLEDVDGGSSTWVDSNFIRSSPAGGDYAGQTAEDALRAAEIEAGIHILAQQIQAEEDNHAQMLRDAFRERQRQKQQAQQEAEERRKNKKNKGCVIM